MARVRTIMHKFETRKVAAKQRGRCMSKEAGSYGSSKGGASYNNRAEGMKDEKKVEEGYVSNWVPHPRSGIYYPKGHEWVMEGVPSGAASFDQSYWLRSVEGVDDLELETRSFI